MGTLLKYEFKGIYKLMIGGAIALIIVNILLLAGVRILAFADTGEGIALFISSFLSVAAVVLVTVSGINSLAKDLFTDTGYLTFTLPRSGYSIIGAKLIAVIIEMTLACILCLALVMIHLYNLNGPINLNELWDDMAPFLDVIVLIVLSLVVGFINFTLSAYFSLAAARSILSGRKYGKATAFGIFIALSTLINWLGIELEKLFPYYLDFEEKSFGNISLSFSSANGVSIAVVALVIVSTVLLYLGSAWLIERKADI